MSKRWYIVQAQTNMEKKAQSLLQEKIENSPLKDKFGQLVVPEEQVTALKNGKSTVSTRKFYPGYVFVEMDFDDETWHLIKTTRYVIGFIGGTKTKPSPISQREMDQILGKMEASKEAPVPKQTFDVGGIVLVVDGPFKDFEGTIESVNYNQGKLKVSILIFGRPTLTDFEFSQVAKKE